MEKSKGQIIRGNFDKILVRLKQDEQVEIGELLISECNNYSIIFQVIDIYHSSQVSDSNIEYLSGMIVEDNTDVAIMDKHLRYYKVAELKALLHIKDGKARMNKTLADMFSKVRQINKKDISFLTKPENPLFLGNLRSGSEIVDCDIFLNGKDALSHHILIGATTGKGKSNLNSCILWNLLNHEYSGVLVLDPHDEYYGRNALGMKDHPNKNNVAYYTPYNVPHGQRTLKINLNIIKPSHLKGSIYLTDAQNDALYTYYKKYKKKWIESIITGEEIIINGKPVIHESTLGVLKRKLMSLLDIKLSGSDLSFKGIFDNTSGESTISDICSFLEQGKTTIIDTSYFSGSLEILVGSIIASEILSKYKNHKREGILNKKPVISIVLEEAPRVLGKDALESGGNIFSSIAKEGRKFNIGLCAITQLPSLIPKDILANMNTKIILGMEMSSERQAIIDSSAQDLSSDDKNIASLDKGEAIITSTFTKFATPVKIPLFSDMVRNTTQKKDNEKKPIDDFSGIRLE